MCAGRMATIKMEELFLGWTPPKNHRQLLNEMLQLGARLRGRTATQRSEKGSEKVLGRVLGKGFSEGF